VALSSRSGVDVHSIVEAGQSFTVTDMNEIRDKTLMYMTMMMDRYDSRRLLVSGVAMRWAGSRGPRVQGPPSSRQNKFKIILQILGCELRKSAFGGRARPRTARGAIALPQTL